MTWCLDRSTAVDDVVARAIQVSLSQNPGKRPFSRHHCGPGEGSGSLISQAESQPGPYRALPSRTATGATPGSASRPAWAVEHGSRVCHSRLARTLALAYTPREQAEYPTSRGCRFATKQARSYRAPRRSLLVRGGRLPNVVRDAGSLRIALCECRATVAHELAQHGCVGVSPDEREQRRRVEVGDLEPAQGAVIDRRRRQDRDAEPTRREVGN
jgi:hypothetical protein